MAVIRRSFRIGLWLGILSGLVVAIVKLVQRGRLVPEPPRWSSAERASEPAPVVPQPEPAPIVPEPVVPQPEPAPIVPEPIVPEPAPEPLVPEPGPEPLVPEPAPEPQPPSPSAAKAANKAAPAAKKAKAPAPKAATLKRTLAPWVDPEGNTCPSSHPVKAKLATRIFHVPGGISYERTTPDRCYQSPEAAEADGLRASKR